jgi:hypothetical protein
VCEYGLARRCRRCAPVGCSISLCLVTPVACGSAGSAGSAGLPSTRQSAGQPPLRCVALSARHTPASPCRTHPGLEAERLARCRNERGNATTPARRSLCLQLRPASVAVLGERVPVFCFDAPPPPRLLLPRLRRLIVVAWISAPIRVVLPDLCLCCASAVPLAAAHLTKEVSALHRQTAARQLTQTQAGPPSSASRPLDRSG